MNSARDWRRNQMTHGNVCRSLKSTFRQYIWVGRRPSALALADFAGEVMSERLTNTICSRVAAAADLYEQLVVVAGPDCDAKAAGTTAAADQPHAPCVNASLELGQAPLELTARQRSLEAPRLLEEIVAAKGGALVFLKGIELLFLPALKVEPLRLLQNLSRSRTVVVDWPGPVQGGSLVYAEPGHPEYRKYPVADAGIVVDAAAES